VSVREFHALCTEPVKMRRINITLITTKRFDISVSEIVSKDEHNVGAISGYSSVWGEGAKECNRRAQDGCSIVLHGNL
jgi:hypothetical protein